jgi:RES domain
VPSAGPQSLAERLLEAGGLGVAYPSVRHPGGSCLAVFRPALVAHVRRDATWCFAWTGGPVPEISHA